MVESVTPPAEADEVKGDYWDRYYARDTKLVRPLPSQFATFVAGELQEPHRVVELGCGNGRDSIFFASFGHTVVGVDGSKPAVEHCGQLARELNESATFIAAQIDDPSLAERIPDANIPTVVYARFFLHAVTESEEQKLLDLVQAITKVGDLMAVEYRTVRDQSQEKVTDSHYRRFIRPADFERRAIDHGFHVEYAVEGFGFAKYKIDDAYVARCLLIRAR